MLLAPMQPDFLLPTQLHCSEVQPMREYVVPCSLKRALTHAPAAGTRGKTRKAHSKIQTTL